MIRKFITRKLLPLFVLLPVVLNFYFPLQKNSFSPKLALADDTQCTEENTRAYLSAQVGGVSLDKAATFLADMSDIVGAYYDLSLDRIVFVGQKNTTAPKFNKDDMAVAIRALFFNNAIPAVSMEYKDPNNPFGDPNLNVLYYGGIEDTQFGKTMLEADYRLKIYSNGYDENNQKITSSVPGYKSFFDRFLEKNPTPDKRNYSRLWISPLLVSLKKDDTATSFVFDQVKMQVETEGLKPDNDPVWNQAAIEFAQQQTDLYDQFAAETPSYYQTKQLAKIVSVIKWLKDNNISSDFYWAKDYQPKYVATPREIPRLTTPDRQIGNTTWRMTGGVTYDTPNTYNADNGTSSSLKNSSQAVPTTKEDVHWTFTQNNQQYDSVAVSAQAFRSLGAYSISTVDLSIPVAGELALLFQRAYSSFIYSQSGIGRGWTYLPSKLYDNKLNWTINCTTGATGIHPWKLAFESQSGGRETFTFYNCDLGYTSDDPSYHTKIFHNSDGTFTARLINQTDFIFNNSYKLTNIKDKNGNAITYNYDASGKLISLSDANNHSLTLAYNTQGLISSLSDWASRVVSYGYDGNGNLISVTDPRGNVTKYTYDSNNKLATVVNRNNQSIIQNTYNPEAKILTQKDASGNTLSYFYDNQAKTINISDANRTSKVTYDDKARVLTQTDPLIKSTTFTYGNELSPLTVTDKNNNKTTYTYDANGNTTSILFPNNIKVTYEYDAKNFLTRILDDRYKNVNSNLAKETKYTYDSKGNHTKIEESSLATSYVYNTQGLLTKITNPKGSVFNYTRDLFGNILTAADPLNNTVAYEYDSLGRKVKITDPDNKISSFNYDKNNNVINKTDASGVVAYNYDPENRLQKTTLPNNAVTEFSYNSQGLLSLVKDPLNSLTSYGYDSYQNLISQQDALNNTTAYLYDKLNRQTQAATPLGKVTKWEYDGNGNLIKRIAAANQTTTYTYDSLNRLTKISYPDLSSVTYDYDNRGNLLKTTGSAGSTSYTYDLYDRLTKVTNPYSKNVSYTYDTADNLTKITYPDSRAVSYDYDNGNFLKSVSDWNNTQISYTYNKNGTLISRVYPNGITTLYGYDGSNRLLSVEHKSQTTLAKFTYERDGLGNITKVTEEGSWISSPNPTLTPALTPTPTITSTPTLTPTGRPTPTPSSTTTPVPSPTPTKTPTLVPTSTPVGSKPDIIITSVTINPLSPARYSSFTISTVVKNQGSLTTGSTTMNLAYYYDRTSSPNSSSTYDASYTTIINLSPGQQVQVNYPSAMFRTSGSHNIYVMADQANRISESDENNNVFGPVNLTVAMTGVDKYFAYKINSLFSNNVYAQEPGKISTFAYDLLGRLTGANYFDGKTYAYTYNGTDNRTSQTVQGIKTDSAFNNDSQLTQSGIYSYSYNANGNLTNINATSRNQAFTYNYEDWLTGYTAPNLSTTSFTYDATGNRIQKVTGVNTIRYVNDLSGPLSRVIAETDWTNSIKNYYVYGLNLVSQGTWINSSRSYFLEDGMGNIRFLTNASGASVKNYDYDPFGNIRSTTGTSSTSYEFSGEQFDTESGLYFLRARYYDPATGRFITKDPLKGTPANPQTLNPYTYSLNNPINLSDPSGESPIPLLLKCSDLILKYNKLTPMLRNSGMQAHHIIEARFGPILGQVVNKMESVALNPETHQMFTNRWREAIGYIGSNNPLNTGNVDINKIWSAAQKVYAEYPELLQEAKIILFGQ